MLTACHLVASTAEAAIFAASFHSSACRSLQQQQLLHTCLSINLKYMLKALAACRNHIYFCCGAQ
jgi:hypothetical protein